MVEKIYLLRHGLRLDGEDETYFPYYAKRKDDTPLSYHGIVQAEETADFLEHEKIDHIFVSPFFRTLQTAHYIAKRKGKLMNIEYGFMEQLSSEWFSSFPVITPSEEVFAAFPTVNREYESLVVPTFPEHSSNTQVFDRTGRTVRKVMDLYSGTILICGHGASMWETARNLTSDLRGYNKKSCSLHKFVKEQNQWRLVLSTTDHLTYIDNTYDDPKLLNTVPEPYRKHQECIDQFPIELKLDRVRKSKKGVGHHETGLVNSTASINGFNE